MGFGWMYLAPALELGLDLPRIHHMARVGGGDDAAHLHQTAGTSLRCVISLGAPSRFGGPQ